MTYATCGCMDTMVGSLRGMGSSVTPMITSLLGSCVLRLVYVATIFKMNPTPTVLYMCYPITWGVTLLANVLYFVYYRRKIEREA